MSFQAYIDNIKTKTGKSPDDFKKLADKKGLLKESVKAAEIVKWFKSRFWFRPWACNGYLCNFQRQKIIIGIYFIELLKIKTKQNGKIKFLNRH